MSKLQKNIVVGIVDRDDTYTGKLGFISYLKNAKGDIQHSIKGWVDRNEARTKTKNPYMYFENTPTEGFVINKKVGGRKPHYGDYKGRTVKARVYDPRGFEFEIDMENICHILEHSSTSVGKALDGEFVYAWLGSGSVFLLSCRSEIYKQMTQTKEEKKKSESIELISGQYYVSESKIPKTLYYLGNSKTLSFNWRGGIDSIRPNKTIFVDMFGSIVFTGSNLRLANQQEIAVFNSRIKDRKRDIKNPNKSLFGREFIYEYHKLNLTPIDFTIKPHSHKLSDNDFAGQDLLSVFRKHKYLSILCDTETLTNMVKLINEESELIETSNGFSLFVKTSIKDCYLEIRLCRNTTNYGSPNISETISMLNRNELIEVNNFQFLMTKQIPKTNEIHITKIIDFNDPRLNIEVYWENIYFLSVKGR